jgi:hypothetical protein
MAAQHKEKGNALVKDGKYVEVDQIKSIFLSPSVCPLLSSILPPHSVFLRLRLPTTKLFDETLQITLFTG